MFIYKIPNKYLRYKCTNQGTRKAFSSLFSTGTTARAELKGKLLMQCQQIINSESKEQNKKPPTKQKLTPSDAD